ncbi:AAA family ATPase [Paenibacillus abyssi]|uniref:AAA family ATPase n=1 Tax=Paenibacillus abyssi TaxID=1340531 RepID=A0A917CWC0_9BACL|nr:AAA family ATPase [Paenibacillus abyssi]GGG01999.1 hypothetical protein GCM10010916_18930 [Paenibacillus abyssi]
MLKRIKATVDRAVSELATTSKCQVTIDQNLMEQADLQIGDVVAIETGLGRHTLGRVAEPLEKDTGSGIIRLDRFLRQSIKARINEDVRIEKKELEPVSRVILSPPIDVSRAHHLIEHLSETFSKHQTPVMVGSVLFATFHDSNAGIIYKVVEVHGAPHTHTDGDKHSHSHSHSHSHTHTHTHADIQGIINEKTVIEVESPDARTVEGAFDTTFEDVGGLGAEIKLVRELIQLPLQFPYMYRQLGIQAPRGILLYGPPGSGKTHFARAIANELQAKFYYINGPSVVGTMYGETESNLRKIFSEAAHHAPSIIFIDEIDAIAPRRDQLGSQSDIRAVTQLLSLMDGLSKVDSVVVIGTTNRVDAVDSAMRRPGRFDREVIIGPPNAVGRLEILQIHTREMPLSSSAVDFLPQVSNVTHGFVGADLMELCREAGLNSLRRSTSSLKHHLEGFQLKPEQITVEPEDFQLALTKIRPSAIREALVSIPDVRWNEIGGLESVKRELQDMVLRPMKEPERYQQMNLTPPRGILLYGAPGTGKTLLAKALANEAGVNFLALDGPEVFSKWLGESEEAIRHIFRVARQLAPSIIFFDQLDAIVPKRGFDSGSRTTERVVNQIMSELDGIESMANIVVIGATNRMDLIDSSILRPGRLGMQIHVPLPDYKDRIDILQVLLATMPLSGEFSALAISEQIAGQTDGFSGADLQAICTQSRLQAMRDARFQEGVKLTAAHFTAAITRIHELKRQENGVSVKASQTIHV